MQINLYMYLFKRDLILLRPESRTLMHRESVELNAENKGGSATDVTSDDSYGSGVGGHPGALITLVNYMYCAIL